MIYLNKSYYPYELELYQLLRIIKSKSWPLFSIHLNIVKVADDYHHVKNES